MKRAMQKGFNLIELMIIVALVALLLAFGLPQLSDMVTNSRVRTAAEGMLNGLQIARAEAVRRNAPVNLVVGTDGISWNVVLTTDATNTAIQTRSADAGAATVTTTTTSNPAGATTITFDSWGTVRAPTSFAIRYSSGGAGTRTMCAGISANTPRLCDPQRSDTTDPQACVSGTSPIVC